jgi:hypothetical protein
MALTKIQPAGIDSSNSTLTLGTSNVTVITIDGSQNVGIGTSSPTFKLDVQSINDTVASVKTTGSIQSSFVRIVGKQAGVDNEWNVIASGNGLAGPQLRFTYGFWTGSPAVVIDSSGNMGVGSQPTIASLGINKITTSPLSGTTTSYGLYLYPTSTGQCLIDAITSSSSSSYLTFRSYNNTTYYSMTLDYNGNFQHNSGYGSTATAYGCRAWVKFGGGTTYTAGAIQGSGGVTSVTAVSTGTYTVNLSFTMPDNNFSAVATTGWASTAYATDNYTVITGSSTTTVVVQSKWAGPALASNFMHVAVFR